MLKMDRSCLYDIDYVNDVIDQSCEECADEVICPDESCPGDFNNDNTVSIADLLAFLILFGNNC